MPLPEALDIPAFRDAWSYWLAYRRESRFRTLKPKTLRARYAELASWGVDAAVRSIRESIANGWQGLFEPKGPAASRRNGYDPGAIPETPPPPRIEALRAEFTRAVRNLCAAAERPVDQEAIERAGQLDEAGLKQFEAAWMKQARPWLEASGAWR